MKTNLKFSSWFAAVLVLVAVGCATTKIDWNARIGTYTFDQAVAELGPPDKQAKLTDGQTVVEWVTRHYANGGVAVGTGFGYGPGSVGYVQNVGPNTYETSLRLTFNTNNVLVKWAKN
jgi:hypothetical protein